MSQNLIQSMAFDVLGDVLETLRFRGSIFMRSELAAPWGMSLAPQPLPRFHVVFNGRCFIGAPQADPVEAGEMDIVLLPNGSPHWIADQPGRELVLSERASEMCELGAPLFQDGDITHRIMCGIVHYDHDAPHPLLSSMPELLHFQKFELADPIWATVLSIDTELKRQGSNSGPIIDRLTEVLVLQLIRQAVESSVDSTGFFAALRDRRLSQALALIHSDPAFDWTLDILGERVGMSRTTLIRHFQDALGEAPMTYLTNWRLMKALRLVQDTAFPLELIADRVGFASARTLSRAFQRQYRQTPNQIRKARNKEVDRDSDS